MANRETLQKTLNANYDLDFFHRNVLQQVFGNSLTLASVPEKRNINASEERLIKSVKKYGTVALTDYRELDLYDVELAENVVIERSRVSIGAAIKKYIFGNNAVLVNFHYQNKPEKSWRLSFIAKEQQIEDGEIIKGETNPKRYTYILGHNETCRTAAERFAKLSMEPEFTIDKLKDAFSVEKLSKTFFDEYKQHYLDFVEHLNKRNIKSSVFNGDEKAIRDFAKKLLGRIVFLYFIQKKGWLGASNTKYADGSPNFLEELFIASGKNESFYHDWLKKLFYDTLNNQSRNEDAFKLPDGEIVRIPFLNGGLFEDNDPKGILTFPPKLFADLFEFFKTYNFTIYEDSPDDHTLAVDPEMLGHIFENLLEDNKDKGAYYTPKEIVHYMCQESLIEYLATKLSITVTASFQQLGKDQTEMFAPPVQKEQFELVLEHKAPATGITRTDVEQFIKHKQLTGEIKKHHKDINKYLDEVKICDPAIGSGAFPMGLLHEIFNAKLLLNEETGINPAEVKQNIIQNTIYGVDIENGAVDIARLRFWLSLIVDEDKPRALPNLDYKIVVGDSLLPKFEGEVVDIDWDLKNVAGVAKPYVEKIKSGLKEIVEKQKQFFKTKSNKPKLQTEIRNLKIDLLINQFTFDKLKYQGKNREQGKLGFTEKTRDEIKKETEIKLKIAGYEQTIKKLESLKRKTSEPLQFFDWKLDFPEIMNPAIAGDKSGFDIVIGNPPYVSFGLRGVKKMSDEDKLIYRNNYPNSAEYKISYYALFMELAIRIGNAKSEITYIVPDSFLLGRYFSKIRNYILNTSKILEHNLFTYKVFGNATVGFSVIFHYQKVLNVLNNSYKAKCALIKSREKFLTKNHQIFLISSDIYINIIHNRFRLFFKKEIFDLVLKVENGSSTVGPTFFTGRTGIRSKVGQKKIIAKKQINQKYKKGLISSSQINKYSISYDDDWINIDGKLLNSGGWEYDIINNPKILIPQTGDSLTAAIDYDHFYHLNNVHSFAPNNDTLSLQYLCSIFNSKLVNYYYKKISLEEDRAMAQIDIETAELLPIKVVSLKSLQKFNNLVDQITKNKKIGKDTSMDETEIDIMVYKLYQLNYDEVLVVDKEFAKHKSREEYDKLDYGFEYVQPDKTAIAKTSGKKKGRSSNFDLLKDLEF